MAAFSFLSRRKSDNIKSLNPSEFRKLITESTTQILDVRTPEEYAQQKIEGAQLINIYDSNFEEIATTTLDVAIPIAVYCRSGIRSLSAARILAKKGFTVYNLRGGILLWKNSHLPI